MKRTLIALLVFVLSAKIQAQDSETGAWFIYFGNQKISKKMNLWNEVQVRNYDIFSDRQQLLLRAGLGYDLSENNNNVLIGYAFINSQNYIPNSDEKNSVNEHRMYQQFIHRNNFGRVFLQHRLRMEQRFLPNDFQSRGRYFLSANIPINNNKMLPKTIYASAYNEVFVNLQNQFFDRNRIYGALGFVFDKNWRIEAGYMNQALPNSSRGQFQLVIFNNLPIFKQK